MTRLLVNAHGPDHPGMVAAVSKVLVDNGCNLEDTSMTRLGGHFTMLLTARPEGEVQVDALQAALASASESGITCSVVQIEEPVRRSDGGERWALSLYGKDQKGIVATISDHLASKGVNVDDMTTRLTGTDNARVYTVLIDVTIPTGQSDAVIEDLEAVAADLGITCHSRPTDADTL